MDIQEVLTRKAGPFPVWVWTLMATGVAGGFMLLGKKKETAATAATGQTAGGGDTGKFDSSQSSTTTDKNGNTTTSNYSASGGGFGFPGMMTTQAFPMPYSMGDWYNNIATTVNVPTGGTTVNLPPPDHDHPHHQHLPPVQQETQPPPGPPDFPAPGSVYRVNPNDSLWFIAKYTLQSRGQDWSNASIDSYWKSIYNANRGLIGGNPDLIHPGQVFVLP